MTDKTFQPCSDTCVCQDYPDLRGACDETVDEGCSVDCVAGDCECDKRDALQTYARAVDRLSSAVLLLGQMIDETLFEVQ